MDSQGQLQIFCVCVAVGYIGGLFYEIFLLPRLLLGCEKGKNKAVGIIIDIAFCICFAIFCAYAAYEFRFPNLRFYMWIGYGVGITIYLKTLRRIVAFFQKVCYNKAIKVAKRRKTKKKLSKAGDKL